MGDLFQEPLQSQSPQMYTTFMENDMVFEYYTRPPAYLKSCPD